MNLEFEGKHPPVAPVFFAFRVMVGVGMLMLAVSWLSAWQIKRKGEPKRWLAYVLVGMAFSGWIATTAGWYTTEGGRQPYLVYGVLTTAQAAATNVTAGMIGATLAMYLTLYAVLIAAFISVVFYLARKASVKPDPLSEQAFSSIGVEKMVEGKL